MPVKSALAQASGTYLQLAISKHCFLKANYQNVRQQKLNRVMTRQQHPCASETEAGLRKSGKGGRKADIGRGGSHVKIERDYMLVRTWGTRVASFLPARLRSLQRLQKIQKLNIPQAPGRSKLLTAVL